MMLAGDVVVVGFELFCSKFTSTHTVGRPFSHIFVYVELKTGEEKLTSSPL